MNSDHWQDIYRRQPMPTELPAKFDEAAFLREIAIDESEIERQWNTATRRSLYLTFYFIVAGITNLTTDVWWGGVIFVVWNFILGLYIWRHRVSSRRVEREFGASLLEWIGRAEALISLRRSFRHFGLWLNAPICGLFAGGWVAHSVGPKVYSHHPWLVSVLSIGFGLSFAAVFLYWAIGENRQQEAVAETRLDHLRRVKSRLLGEQANDPTTSFPP